MGISYYTGTADGTTWTFKKTWTDGTYPSVTSDKSSRFYIFRVYSGNIEMATSDDPSNAASWSAFSTVISSVDLGDIGALCNQDIGTYGRIMLSYWKSSARKVSYSDDRGSSWTEVSV